VKSNINFILTGKLQIQAFIFLSNVRKWGVGPKVIFHEGGIVGRSISILQVKTY
jgi:hypothetical protein